MEVEKSSEVGGTEKVAEYGRRCKKMKKNKGQDINQIPGTSYINLLENSYPKLFLFYAQYIISAARVRGTGKYPWLR